MADGRWDGTHIDEGPIEGARPRSYPHSRLENMFSYALATQLSFEVADNVDGEEFHIDVCMAVGS